MLDDLPDELQVVSRAQQQSRLPKIALVVDTDDWAFANIARQIEARLGERYEFETITAMSVDNNTVRLMFLLRGFDLIHFFWRDQVYVLHSPWAEAYANEIGHDIASLRERFLQDAVLTTAVYDHLFLTEDEIRSRGPLFQKVAGYYVSSQKLFDLYSKLDGYPKPFGVIPDGVDLSKFKPQNLDRFRHLSDGRPLAIGWVGNSKWAAHLNDPKGISLIRSALDQLRAEGVAVEPRFADVQERFVPHDDMPSYYAGIDVLLCASEIEGTPNPVLEAMACGVPIITTDVGIVREALGPLQSEFILETRSVEALKSAIRRLHSQRELFLKLSEENLRMVRGWDWSEKVLAFSAFFDAMLAVGSPQDKKVSR